MKKKTVLLSLMAFATLCVQAQNYTMTISTDEGSRMLAVDDVRSILFRSAEYADPAMEGVLDEQVLPYPAEYANEAEHCGKVVRMSYEAADYTSGDTVTKYALVYLPYGYDGKAQQRYNVLFMMHGMGDRYDTYLKAPGSTSEVKRALDHLIESGVIEPLIVVTPTIYLPDRYDTGTLTAGINRFPQELMTSLLPAVAHNYRTYATGVTMEHFSKARAHFAMAGFSAGSVTTWNVFANCLPYIKEYVPMSGALGMIGGTLSGNASTLAGIIADAGLGARDFHINAMSGSDDYAASGLAAQIRSMDGVAPFVNGLDKGNSNVCYREYSGGAHDYKATVVYIYNALLTLFR